MSLRDGAPKDNTARTYVLVLACEAAVIAGLWILQRIYS
jgi:hypothetical protein